MKDKVLQQAGQTKMTTFSINQINFYTVSPNDEGQRIDNLLIKILKGVPKSHIYRIIRSGEVRINKKRATALSKVALNDIIRIPPIKIIETKSAAESSVNADSPYIPKIDFPIIFEDDYFLVINKPAGTACHGGSGVSFGVIEILRKTKPTYQFLELAHRLDRDTSGILILAKKRSALVEIQNLMRHNLIKKYYLALTIGAWANNPRSVKAPLYKYLTPNGERRVSVDHDLGKYSQTIFTPLTHSMNTEYDERTDAVQTKHNETYTLVKADLMTGRTHQIRAHLQHIGHPILGDEKYGDFEINKKLAKLGLKRMFLHAYEIKFMHPITKESIKLNAPIPASLNKFFAVLHIERPKIIDDSVPDNIPV